MPNVSLPDLALVRPIANWVPQYGDLVIWSKWFTTWYGFVIDEQNDKIFITFEGTPHLLVTMNDVEITRNIKRITMFDIKGQRRGKWSIIQSDKSGNRIWYI